MPSRERKKDLLSSFEALSTQNNFKTNILSKFNNTIYAVLSNSLGVVINNYD